MTRHVLDPDDLTPPEAVRATLDDLDVAASPETVSLTAARGRVLAERIDAPRDVPGFDRVRLDGYALRAMDIGDDETTLTVVDHVGAGERPERKIESGEAVEVETGAVLPPGADAMVPVERTERDGDRVVVSGSVAPGDAVAPAGEDVAAGGRVLGPGTLLTPREVALLGAMGLDEVPVQGRPSVGIVSIGEELVAPGEPVDTDRGAIHDTNATALAAAVEEAGGDPHRYPIVGDDRDRLREVLLGAADERDLVVSSGSTSAGTRDFVPELLAEEGDLLLHGARLKPGKPLVVGRLDGTPYVGLPGYPVSAMTTFREFVAPIVRATAGRPEPERASVRGRLTTAYEYDGPRLRLLAVALVEDGDGDLLVYPVDRGSGATTTLANADGVVEMPPDRDRLEAGREVTVDLFSADVRPPDPFGVGADDPALSRLLDHLSAPRYLPVGSRPGLDRLDAAIPDFAAVAGPHDAPEAAELAAWTREWGLVVPRGNPEAVSGLADLVDRDLRLANRTTDSGLRESLAAELAALADQRGVDRDDLAGEIRGFDFATRGHESPARRVAAGDADAGLSLRATAEKLDCGFVSLGTQRVVVYANPDRTDKPGVEALSGAVDALPSILDDLPGYTPAISKDSNSSKDSTR